MPPDKQDTGSDPTDSSALEPKERQVEPDTKPATKLAKPTKKTPNKPYVKGKPKKKKLTQYQATYIKALLDGHNATDSARIAYPDSSYPNHQAYQTLQKANVRDALLDKLESINYQDKIKDTYNQVFDYKGASLQEKLAISDRKIKVTEQLAKIVGLFAPVQKQTLSVKASLRPVRERGK